MTERSVSPISQKPKRTALSRKELIELKKRLTQPKVRLDLEQEVPISDRSSSNLFQKALRDKSPLNPEFAKNLQRTPVRKKNAQPRSTVSSVRSAINEKYARVFNEQQAKMGKGCTFRPDLSNTQTFNKSVSPSVAFNNT